jgi:large subunit ribosomal protein L18
MKKAFNKLIQRKRRHVRNRSRLQGTSEKPRLIVFRSLMHMHAQLIDDSTGKTLAAAHDMKSKKGTKTERATEVGKTLGELALKAGVKTCVFDRNGYKYHGRVKAVAEAARESGLKF